MNLSAAELQAAMNKYKSGFALAPKHYKEDRTKSQKLPSTQKTLLVKNTADKLTSSLSSVCPITGLVSTVNFPAKPGFYLEAHHPIVHNCKAMVKDSTYWPLLDREQKAGLILASLHFYSILSLESPALVVNLAIQSSLNDHQLDLFLDFIATGISCTNKGYPVLSLNTDVNEQTFLSYMAKCDEIEHTNLEAITLESLPELEQRLFKVPKFLASDKRGSAMDKEAYDLYLNCKEWLPSGLVAKAAPFVKTLITNPSHAMINKLVAAVEGKWSAPADKEHAAECDISEFAIFVKANREVASKLNIYPDLTPSLFGDKEKAADDELELGRPALSSLPATATTEIKVLSPFETRMAAIKAKAAAAGEL
jgi:hypothetical protein